ncbi:hypothetical protein HWV62_14628 [Athelia sp. TMB]|nr:hypothetical protein HWV62_14628 [Athelia sp. TMB]
MSLAALSPLSIRKTGISMHMARYYIDIIGINVTVVSSLESADMALRQFFNPAVGVHSEPEKPPPIISVDTEWTPISHEAPKDLVPDVVQISDGQRVVILQCNMIRGNLIFRSFSSSDAESNADIPELLVKILESPNIIVTGVAVAEDLRRIANWAALESFAFPKVIDLGWMAWEIAPSDLPRSAHISGYAPTSIALATLSRIFGDVRLDKSLTLLSGWHGIELSEQQILYASMDVVAACSIYRHLSERSSAGVDSTWFMTVKREYSVIGTSERRWKSMPNIVNVVDGIELAAKQREEDRLRAQEERLRLAIPVLRTQKARLIKDIKTLENTMKGIVRRAVEQGIVL